MPVSICRAHHPPQPLLCSSWPVGRRRPHQGRVIGRSNAGQPWLTCNDHATPVRQWEGAACSCLPFPPRASARRCEEIQRNRHGPPSFLASTCQIFIYCPTTMTESALEAELPWLNVTRLAPIGSRAGHTYRDWSAYSAKARD